MTSIIATNYNDIKSFFLKLSKFRLVIKIRENGFRRDVAIPIQFDDFFGQSFL